MLLADIILYRSRYFIDLLSNCAWYLYEASDYGMCLRLVETAWSACEDKTSLRYATLCNIAGGAYYELNKLAECRKYWERMMTIRDTLLPEHDLEVSEESSPLPSYPATHMEMLNFDNEHLTDLK
jgi:hypothetical protein